MYCFVPAGNVKLLENISFQKLFKFYQKEKENPWFKQCFPLKIVPRTDPLLASPLNFKNVVDAFQKSYPELTDQFPKRNFLLGYSRSVKCDHAKVGKWIENNWKEGDVTATEEEKNAILAFQNSFDIEDPINPLLKHWQYAKSS